MGRPSPPVRIAPRAASPGICWATSPGHPRRTWRRSFPDSAAESGSQKPQGASTQAMKCGTPWEIDTPAIDLDREARLAHCPTSHSACGSISVPGPPPTLARPLARRIPKVARASGRAPCVTLPAERYRDGRLSISEPQAQPDPWVCDPGQRYRPPPTWRLHAERNLRNELLQLS